MRTRACNGCHLGCARARIAYRRTGVKSSTGGVGPSRGPGASAGSERARRGVGRGHLLPGPQEALRIPGRHGARGRRTTALSGSAAMRDSASRQTAVTAGREGSSASLVERTAVPVRGTTTRAAIAAPVMRPPSWSRSDQPVRRGAASAATLDRDAATARARRGARGRRAGARRRERELGQVTLAGVARARWSSAAGGRRAALAVGDERLEDGAMGPAGGGERHHEPRPRRSTSGNATSPHAPPNRRSALRRTRRSRSAWWIRLLTVPSGSSSASAVSWSDGPRGSTGSRRLVLHGQPGDPLADDLAQLGPLGARVGLGAASTSRSATISVTGSLGRRRRPRRV